MADNSSPPPSFVGYPSYNPAGSPPPTYGMGARGELLVTVSGGAAPENDVVWATVAETGKWFYVPPSVESGGAIMLVSSAAAGGGATGGTATERAGTGVFLPETRIRTVPTVQQPIATNWPTLVPQRDVKAPSAGGNYRNPELKTDAGNGKEIQMSYAAAVRRGSSHAGAAMEAGPSQQGNKFSRQKKRTAMAATAAAPAPEEEATAPTVDDIPELVMLPEEWEYDH
ncbi:hypothetical protein E2562_021692 [Oryza meyeriana var. granulata]|uniref:Uncharacterized protein n=1 Tax=Oryza meyeriana var. granulata TaxID=110450 RepID=A0A6G1DZY3_9ORYZ|nr:hypothetical protein E2562_021692 [Oryza meyeriana var. granulata]